MATNKDLEILEEFSEICNSLSEITDEEYLNYVHDLGLRDYDGEYED